MNRIADEIRFVALYLQMQALRRLWGAAAAAAVLAGPRIYRGYARIRCAETLPVEPHPARCHWFAGHRGHCLTDVNMLGEPSPRGVRFTRFNLHRQGPPA